MGYRIELLITGAGNIKDSVVAIVEEKLGTETAVVNMVIEKNGTRIYEEDVSGFNKDTVELIVVTHLRRVLTSYDPESASIKVVRDDDRRFAKHSYGCPYCNKKFFDSWGKVSGVVVKCIRCQRVGYPVERS
jgi:hypothetical protein